MHFAIPRNQPPAYQPAYDPDQGMMAMLPPLDIDGIGDGDSIEDGRARRGQPRRRARARPRGRRRARPRGREETDEEGGGGDGDEEEDDEEETAVEQPPEYFPVGAEDYNLFFQELGEPTPQHRCFGCRYAGMARSGKFSDIAIKEIFTVMAEGIGVTWPPALAVEVSLLQETYRKQVNKKLKPGELKVPKWKPANVLVHWILHTADPQIRQWLQLMRIQAQMYHIERHALNARSRFTGRVMPHKDNTMTWSRLLHDWWFVSAKDPRKFSYFTDGTMFDPKSVTNPGGFVTKGRPVYNFYGAPGQNKRRRLVDNQHTE